MRNHLECEYDFEELSIVLNGKISTGGHWFGKATLVGDEEHFFVSEIILNDGTTLRPDNRGGKPQSFEAELFNRISDVIENEKTPFGDRASREWADVVEDAMEDA